MMMNTTTTNITIATITPTLELLLSSDESVGEVKSVVVLLVVAIITVLTETAVVVETAVKAVVVLFVVATILVVGLMAPGSVPKC